MNRRSAMQLRDHLSISVDHRARSGFSLIELLVVVSIIVLIIAMLMPSLSKVRETARELICKSNLRQQGIAMGSYIVANGKYPGHATSINGQATAIWPTRLRAYAGGDHGIFFDPSAPDGFQWQKLTGTPGGSYATTAASEFGYEPGERILNVFQVPFSYGYNDWGSHNRPGYPIRKGPQRGLGGDIRAFINVNELPKSQVLVPSNMMAIMESVVDASWDFNVDPWNPREWPGKYHRDGTNVLHCDNHVEWFLQSDLTNVNEATPAGIDMAKKWNNHNEWWWVTPGQP